MYDFEAINLVKFLKVIILCIKLYNKPPPPAKQVMLQCGVGAE